MGRSQYEVIIRTSLDHKASKRDSGSLFDKIGQDAEKAAKREADAFTKSTNARITAEQRAAREVERINQQTTRQADQQSRIQERAAKSLADHKQRLIKQEQDAFLRAEHEKTVSAQVNARLQAAAVDAAKGTMIVAWGLIKAAALAAFVAITAAVIGLGLVLRDAIDLAVEVQNAFKGLNSVATFKGISGKDAEDAVRNLRFVRGGMISIGDAATGLKNLLSTGFGLKESVALMEAFSDSAAFGKQAALSYGDAIRSATEGVKNQNSILVDNAGVTKNLSVILKERGFALEDLSDKVKGAGAREALYKGILAETTAQTGDADKVMAGFSGRMAALAQGWLNLKVAVGQYITTIPFVSKAFEAITGFVNKLTADFPAFAKNISDQAASFFASLPATTKAAFADMLQTVVSLGGQIVQWFKDNYALILGAVATTLNKIAEFWQRHGEQIKETARAMLEGILGVMRAGLQVLNGDWNSAWNTLANGVQKQGPILVRVATNLIHILARAIIASSNIIAEAAIALGVELVRGIERGIQNRVGSLLNTITQTGSAVVKAMTGAWLIRSPSLVFMKIGEQAMEGLSLGLEIGSIKVQKQIRGLLEVGNIDLTKRPIVHNPDGTISTVRSQSFGIDGREVLLPTVSDTGRILTATQALQQYIETGRHLGIFKDANSATAYANQLHKEQAILYGNATAAMKANIAVVQTEIASQRTLSDLLDSTAAKFTKEPKKPAEHAAKQIADLLRDQAQALREIGGKESAVDKINRLFADPSVAKRIDERTIAILRMSAAMQDAQKLTRERRAIGDITRQRRFGLDEGSAIRDRRVGPETFFIDEDTSLVGGSRFSSTRARRTLDPVDIELGRSYSTIIDNLNDKIGRHSRLTQVQITLQQLERAGLSDLTDSRAQEALAIASQIDQEGELFKMRERIREVAEDISSVFARAVEDWSGSFGNFFKSIGRGFADLLKQMIASTVFSGLSNVFQNIFGRIFGIGGQQQAGGGGFGGIFSRIFGGGTPGIAGGPGAGGILGAGLLGGISVPGSASAATGTWAQLAGILPGATGGAAATGGVFSAAGLGATLGPMLPLLGAGLGFGIGAPSGLGSVLGGAGGLIAGGIGAAFLAPGLFATTGILGSMGPAIAGLLTNPFTAIAAGGLIVAALILGRNARRRQEEKQRTVLAGDALTQVYQILWAAQRGEVNLSQAKSQYDQIHQAYLAQVAGLKDSKTRRNATLWWNDVDRDVWPKIEAAAKAGQEAKAFSSQFVPTFAGGGVFKAANGLMNIPGVFDRRDDMLMRVSRGEHVAVMNPDQFNRIGGTRTFQQAGVPAFQSGGVSGSTTSAPAAPFVLQQSFSIDANGMVTQVLKSPSGQRIIVEAMDKDHNTNKMDGNLGTIARGLTTRT